MRVKGFIGPGYKLSSVNVDCQRCVNFYPEIDEIQTGKAGETAALLPTPGLTLLCALPIGPVRGRLYRSSKGNLYAVGGNALYQISTSWTVTKLGTLRTDTGMICMSDNGLQLIVVDGLYGYTLDFNNNGFLQITGTALPAADKVVFLDGYFIVNKLGSQQFFISDLYNAQSWNALDSDSADASPDNLVTIEEYRSQLVMFGVQSTQTYYDSGASSFPFAKVPGAVWERGCTAAASVVKVNDLLMWLGEDGSGNGVVWQAAGYNITRASNHAVETAIQGYGDLSGAVAWTYQENGHWFYVLNFANANTSWVWDTATGQWHERTYTNSTGGQERHRANSHAFFNGVHVVGDYANGNIYKLDATAYTDNGGVIIRDRISPHGTSGLNWQFFERFQLDAQTGVGLNGAVSLQGNDPQAMLRWSDDGGHTWSTERWVSLGKIGQYPWRSIWRRLGKSRDRVWWVRVTDPVPVTLIGAEVDMSVGTS